MHRSDPVHNPILGAMRLADDVRGGGGHVSGHGGKHGLALPSVQLVRPADAVRISEVCGACVCLLTLDGCPACAAFAPTWTAFCEALQEGEVLMTHCECSRATSGASKELMAAAANPGGHSTFPAVVVCREGEAATLQGFGSECGVTELQLKVLQTLATGMVEEEAKEDQEDQEAQESQAQSDDEPTPLEALEMADEAEAQAQAEAEAQAQAEAEADAETHEGRASKLRPIVELPDDDIGGDCGCRSHGQDEEEAPVGPAQTADGVTVTHDVAPDEALALAEGADADRRVCMLYFTNWCGHCQHFKPIWNECVVQSGRTGGHLWCAINCESEAGKAAAAREGVRGFPTVHLHHRFREPFGGERSVQGLLDFVHKRSLVPALLSTYKMRSGTNPKGGGVTQKVGPSVSEWKNLSEHFEILNTNPSEITKYFDAKKMYEEMLIMNEQMKTSITNHFATLGLSNIKFAVPIVKQETSFVVALERLDNQDRFLIEINNETSLYATLKVLYTRMWEQYITLHNKNSVIGEALRKGR